MVLDETRTVGEVGHLSDHNSLHDFYNAAVTSGAFDEATGTFSNGSSLRVAKATTETINNSNTFQDDDDLALSVEANTTYIVELFIPYSSGPIPDIRFQFTAPAGVSGSWGVTGAIDGLEENAKRAWTENARVEGSGIVRTCHINGGLIVGATAGTLQLQWAQVNADASDTSVLAGAWMRLTAV